MLYILILVSSPSTQQRGEQVHIIIPSRDDDDDQTLHRQITVLEKGEPKTLEMDHIYCR